MPRDSSTPANEEGRQLRGRTVTAESPKNPTEHICYTCNKRFASSTTLESHKRTHRFNKEPPQKRRAVAPAGTAEKRARIEESAQDAGVSTRSGLRPKFKCKVCGDVEFADKQDWETHTRERHGLRSRRGQDQSSEREQPTRVTRRSAGATVTATPTAIIMAAAPILTREESSETASAAASIQPPDLQLHSPPPSPSAASPPGSAGSRNRNTTLRFEEELDDGQVQCRQCQQVFNNRRGLAAHVAQKHREELDVEQRSIEEERLRKDDVSQRRRRDASRLLYGGIPQVITPQPRHISILNRRSQPSVLQRSSAPSARLSSGLMSTSSPMSSMVYPRRTTLEILTQPAPLHPASSSPYSRHSRTERDDLSKGAYAEPSEDAPPILPIESQPTTKQPKPREPERDHSPESQEPEMIDESAYEFSTEVTVTPFHGEGGKSSGIQHRGLRGESTHRSPRRAHITESGEEAEGEKFPCKFCKDREFLTSYGLERHTKMCHPAQLDEVLGEIRKIQDDKSKRTEPYDGTEPGYGEHSRYYHMDSRHQIPGLSIAAQTAGISKRRFGGYVEKENEPSDTGEVMQMAREQSAALVAGASFTDNRYGPRPRRNQQDAPRAKYQSCDICGILINTEHPKALESHTKAHQKNQELREELLRSYGANWVERVTCRECNLVFKDEDKLDQHRRNVHVRRRHFLCRFCGDVFRNMRDLNIHKERKHEAFEGAHRRTTTTNTTGGGESSPAVDRRPSQPAARRSIDNASGDVNAVGTEEFACRSMCEVCGLQMSRPSNLIRHMKIAHNRTNFTATVETKGMPPFKIDVNDGRFMWGCCDEVFDDRQTFLNHRRNAHGPSYGGQPKECEHCGLTFKTSANYIQHLRTHRPRVCNICGESFGNSVVDLNAFRAHMIRHRDQGYTVRLPPIEEELSSKEQQELWRAINEEEADDGSEDEYSVYSESGLESDIEDNSSEDDGDVPMDQMTCAMCEKKFSCIYAYSEHWKLHCLQPFRENLKLKTKPFSFKLRRPRKPFKCGFCPKSFQRGGTWAMHHLICSQRRRGILPPDEPEMSVGSGASSRISSPTKSPSKPRQDARTASPTKESQVKEVSTAAKGTEQEEALKDLEDQLDVPPTKKKYVPDYIEKAYIVEWDTTKTPLENPYVCQNCHESFGDFLTLIMHVKSHIQNPITEEDEDESNADGEKEKSNQGEEKVTASVVRIRTSTADALGKYACQVCGRCFQEEKALNSHLDEAHRPSKQHRCNLCRRRFWTAVGLRLHERRRHNASSRHYYCGICEKKFVNNESLKAHESKHELENSLYQCEDCGVSFYGLKPLKDHFKANHEGVTIMSCSVCYRIHTDSSALKEHLENDHPGARILCRICNKAFHTPLEARQHRQRVHIEEGKSWESCSLCGKKYYDKRQLAVHLWRHTTEKSYQCRICDAPFDNDEAVRTHLEEKHDIGWLDSRDLIVQNSTVFTKTGVEETSGKEERCFRCHVCGKKFDSKAAVKEHLEQGSHKRTKNIECTACGKKFCKAYNLAAHINRRHPQEVEPEQMGMDQQRDGQAGVAEVIPADVAQLLLNQGQLQYVSAENVQMIVADEATAAAVMAAAGGAPGQDYQVLLVQGENGETMSLSLGPQGQLELSQMQQQQDAANIGNQRIEGQPMEIDETNYQQFLNQ